MFVCYLRKCLALVFIEIVTPLRAQSYTFSFYAYTLRLVRRIVFCLLSLLLLDYLNRSISSCKSKSFAVFFHFKKEKKQQHLQTDFCFVLLLIFDDINNISDFVVASFSLLSLSPFMSFICTFFAYYVNATKYAIPISMHATPPAN